MSVVHLAQEVAIPPYAFLKQIFSNCPQAGSTYIYLWECKEDGQEIHLKKKDAFMLFHPNRLKNNLRKLVNEGLINYSDRKNEFIIEMVEWHEIDE